MRVDTLSHLLRKKCNGRQSSEYFLKSSEVKFVHVSKFMQHGSYSNPEHSTIQFGVVGELNISIVVACAACRSLNLVL